MQRYILFDLDGVIVKTDRSAFEFYREELVRHNIFLKEDDFQLKLGRKSHAFFEALSEKYDLKGVNIEELTQRKRDALTKNVAQNAELIDGANGVLSLLKESGYVLILASQNYREMVENTLAHFNLKLFFDYSFSLEDFGKRKPDPAIYLKCLETFGFAKEQAVVVEDDADGVGAAKNAGLTVVAVATHGKRELISDADYVIDSLADLTPGFLERVFSKLTT